jgi:hypothetical protein
METSRPRLETAPFHSHSSSSSSRNRGSCLWEKKIQNATYDGQLKRRKRGPMWSTKGPKPIMLPLPIHSQNPGQNPPPTVQLWRDCWCPSRSKTPTPEATLILILKGKRRWQMNHQKSSPSKTPTPQATL